MTFVKNEKNFVKFLRTPFFTEKLRWLLLYGDDSTIVKAATFHWIGWCYHDPIFSFPYLLIVYDLWICLGTKYWLQRCLYLSTLPSTLAKQKSCWKRFCVYLDGDYSQDEKQNFHFLQIRIWIEYFLVYFQFLYN